jgi:hypothetical protein
METFIVLQVSTIKYFFRIFTATNGEGKTNFFAKDPQLA